MIITEDRDNVLEVDINLFHDDDLGYTDFNDNFDTTYLSHLGINIRDNNFIIYTGGEITNFDNLISVKNINKWNKKDMLNFIVLAMDMDTCEFYELNTLDTFNKSELYNIILNIDFFNMIRPSWDKAPDLFDFYEYFNIDFKIEVVRGFSQGDIVNVIVPKMFNHCTVTYLCELIYMAPIGGYISVKYNNITYELEYFDEYLNNSYDIDTLDKGAIIIEFLKYLPIDFENSARIIDTLKDAINGITYNDIKSY